MGTVVTIDVYATDGTAGTDLSGQLTTARAMLQRADAVFSTWQPHSPVSRLRRGEITSAQAPAEVCEVLGQCAIARELSGGWFDPWAMPGGLDPTGYVKGWAAQKALGAFRASGICGAIVNAAGDIASLGGLGPGQPFRIGIADPFSPRRLAEVVYLTGAIATSGTYERGHHLIDPHTGRAIARAASASVTGPTSASPTRSPPPSRSPAHPAWTWSRHSTAMKRSSLPSTAAADGQGISRSPHVRRHRLARPRRDTRPFTETTCCQPGEELRCRDRLAAAYASAAVTSGGWRSDQGRTPPFSPPRLAPPGRCAPDSCR